LTESTETEVSQTGTDAAAPAVDDDTATDAATDTEMGTDADADADMDADAGTGTTSEATTEGSGPRKTRAERLEQEGEIAADYLEELLEIADLDGDPDMDVEGDRATVSIVGADLPQRVGDHGEVLEALQELTRLAVYRETGERSRLMLDVSGHRASRRQALEVRAEAVVAQVKESGAPVSLEPMSPFERKVVHDAVAAAGLSSESEGVEPRRYVVVLPA
jgi:spoIIIJ-associated protein